MVAVYGSFGEAEAQRPQAGYKKYSELPRPTTNPVAILVFVFVTSPPRRLACSPCPRATFRNLERDPALFSIWRFLNIRSSDWCRAQSFP
jgi:hypothetical protein